MSQAVDLRPQNTLSGTTRKAIISLKGKRSITRRSIVQAGAASFAAFATGSSIRLSFAVEGASQPINLVTSNANQANTMVEVARQRRFLDDLGLKPTYHVVADGAKAIPSILSGEIDFVTMTGVGLIFPAVARGAPLKILGGSAIRIQQAVYSAKPEIKSVKDLEGRIVGTGAPGALTNQYMVAVLQKKGVDLSKVEFRNVGSNADIFRAIVEGTVDAGPSGIDVYNQQQKYGTHVLSDGDLWTELPEYLPQGAFTSDRSIAEKREPLVRVLAAFAKLYRFVQSPESRDTFVSCYRTVTGDKDDVQGLSTWGFIQKTKPYSVDIVLGDQQISYIQNLNVQLGIQKGVLPFDQVADMSLAHEALKLLG